MRAAGAFGLVSLILAGCSTLPTPQRQNATASLKPQPKPASRYGPEFWAAWGHGQAELNAYDLVYPKYGQLRKGIAVAIFVTEPFSKSLRVKADPGLHAPSDEFPVMKLNLARDYQTGIYDYNDMVSAFVALAEVDGRREGLPAKVSFSSQEWCGHVYSQLLFHPGRVHRDSHSYFDGEADSTAQITTPADTTSEDALLLWARDIGWPALGSGRRVAVNIVTSLEIARATHKPVQLAAATLSVAPDTLSIEVPAGRYRVRIHRAEIEGGGARTYWVETAVPHRVVKWESSDGERAELLGSDRMKYWELNREGGEHALSRLGLTRRGARMP
jgi:hypothetical protein